MKRGRKPGDVQKGSLVYQLAALHKVKCVLIVAERGVSPTMQTISVHFQRSAALRGIAYRQRAVYGVVPGEGRVMNAVLVERLFPGTTEEKV